MADQLLDAKGLNCPLPILRAKKALKDVAMGGTLEVLATDPGAVKDFEAFCRATGNELSLRRWTARFLVSSSNACPSGGWAKASTASRLRPHRLGSGRAGSVLGRPDRLHCQRRVVMQRQYQWHERNE